MPTANLKNGAPSNSLDREHNGEVGVAWCLLGKMGVDTSTKVRDMPFPDEVLRLVVFD